MNYTFFLIDDDGDDRDLFREALYVIDPKIVCHTPMDGRKALAMLSGAGFACPDIIFLDINMPGMTGWECLSTLKSDRRYEHIPVVIYSTSSYAEDIEKAHAGGALCFYNKPNRFTELVESLRLFIKYIENPTVPFPAHKSDLIITPSTSQ